MSNTNTSLATWYEDIVVSTHVEQGEDDDNYYDVIVIGVELEDTVSYALAAHETVMSVEQARELISALEVAIAEIEGV